MNEEQYTRVTFYIVAHADDWQLFMQPNSVNDLLAGGCKVVFIITTAGDAGFNETYWMSREEGNKSSIRFCMAPFAEISECTDEKEFNGHTINHWSANNATCYFLRLPDGNIDGNGFPSTNHHSLTKFQKGEINSIAAVNASATYSNWLDLCTTIEKLIFSESSGIQDISINYLNPDINANPNDHADHISTGQAIQSTTIISNAIQKLFVGYNFSNISENLQGADLLWKAGMFAAYEKAVFDGSGYSTLREGVPIYFKWCLSSAAFITISSSQMQGRNYKL